MNSVFPSFRRHNNNNMLHRIAITMVFESYYSVLLSVMLLTETTNILCHYWQSIKWNHFQGKKRRKTSNATQNQFKIYYRTRLPKIFGHNAARMTNGWVDCMTEHSTIQNDKLCINDKEMDRPNGCHEKRKWIDGFPKRFIDPFWFVYLWNGCSIVFMNFIVAFSGNQNV